MSYVVKSSEKLRKSGADAETKAMLYLMNFRDDSSKMHYFVVDFFNDITGMDRTARKLWDVQSKATKSASAKTIGRELVTLYKNFISDLQFIEYIIFIGEVPDTFRKDQNITIFKSDNINNKAIRSVKEGLIDECRKKEYILDSDIIDEKINDFLDEVWFVIDNKSPQEYIKKIVEKHPALIPSDSDLLAIFNEIRNKQSEKKNTVVEGIVIENADEVLAYGRHLTTNEIRLLVIQRILNTDPLSDGIPTPFFEIYSKYPSESAKDMLDKCKTSLCRALFNKSAVQGFWSLFDRIYTLITENPDATIDYLYNKLEDNIIEQCPDFDALSLKYFIAKTKEGILK